LQELTASERSAMTVESFLTHEDPFEQVGKITKRVAAEEPKASSEEGK
jgi:hypothetical protein